MTNETYKSWLDAMPIDAVRAKIERLEQKLADLRVLERLYGDRHGGESVHEGAAPQPGDTASEGEAPSDDPAASPPSGQQEHHHDQEHGQG